MDAIAGIFEIHWPGEDLERVRRTILKKHDAETHAQTAIEAALELKRRHRFEPSEIERRGRGHLRGGLEPDRRRRGGRPLHRRRYEGAGRPTACRTVIAAALLDGRVMPEQYLPERIARADVQGLLARVQIRPNAALSHEYPNEMPCRMRIALRDGRVLTKEMREYPGFYTQPMSWEMALRKFELLAEPYTTPELRRAIADAVANLENLRVADLMALLANVRAPREAAA